MPPVLLRVLALLLLSYWALFAASIALGVFFGMTAR